MPYIRWSSLHQKLAISSYFHFTSGCIDFIIDVAGKVLGSASDKEVS